MLHDVLTWFSYTLPYRCLQKRSVAGITVALLLPGDDEWAVAEERLAAAIGLIARFAPERHRRLLRDVRAIWVLGERVGARAVWVPDMEIVQLRQDVVADPATTLEELASILVHEGSHATLWRHGFKYPEAQRARIERICVRSELAFFRRVPGAERLAAERRRCLDLRPEDYTDRALAEGRMKALETLGFPAWLLRIHPARRT